MNKKLLTLPIKCFISKDAKQRMSLKMIFQGNLTKKQKDSSFPLKMRSLSWFQSWEVSVTIVKFKSDLSLRQLMIFEIKYQKTIRICVTNFEIRLIILSLTSL